MLGALAPMQFPTWPFPAAVHFSETSRDTGSTRTLTIDQWCVYDPTRLGPPPEFHPEVFKLLRRMLAKQPERFESAIVAGERACSATPPAAVRVANLVQKTA